ncbi:MAG: amidohydrolase [Gammaproteobacteria bacterium]
MRTLKVFCSLLVSTLTCGLLHAAEPPADSVYRNGRIYTVDASHAWAQAVAIKDGKFVYVGSDAGVKAYTGASTRVVDLQGKMAMPGLHDAHQHLHKAQMRFINCNIPGESGVEQIIAALKVCARGKKTSDWIVADVYRGDLFPGGKAHRRYLDAEFPDTPIYIREWSYHHGLANGKALELAGVTRTTPDPQSGRILHDEKGELTGELLSKATWLVTKAIPPMLPATMRDAVLKSARLCNQFGITSAQEATANELMLTEIKALDDKGEWPLRLAAHIVWGNPASSLDSMEGMERTIANRAAFRSKHVATDFVKIYVDGSPLQPHATDVELDEHNHVPEERLYETVAALNAALVRFDKMGIKVKMHAVGDGATRVALDAIEAARKANGDSGILHDIAHSLRYSPQDIGRLAALGAVAEMSPAIWQIKGPLTKNLAGAWQFRTLWDKGTLLTIGSDWVVLPNPNLFPAIAGLLDHGKESLNLTEALRMATLNGAVSVGWQKTNGSIEVGKFADLIVLDRNLFDIPSANIADTRVLTTLLEGRVVYSAQR